MSKNSGETKKLIFLRFRKGKATYRFWFHDLYAECKSWDSNTDFAIDCLNNGYIPELFEVEINSRTVYDTTE